MAGDASERLRWVVETLAVQPDEHVLEAGCGHGIAVDLVCEQLTTGTITALDRSPKMIDLATKRNQQLVDASKAVLITANFHEAVLPRDRYDRIFAVNVASFWTKAERDLGRTRELLALDGTLWLFGHGPTEKGTHEFADSVPPILEKHGFVLKGRIMGEISAGPIAALQFRPR